MPHQGLTREQLRILYAIVHIMKTDLQGEASSSRYLITPFDAVLNVKQVAAHHNEHFPKAEVNFNSVHDFLSNAFEEDNVVFIRKGWFTTSETFIISINPNTVPLVQKEFEGVLN